MFTHTVLDMRTTQRYLAEELLATVPIQRGEHQGVKKPDPNTATYELANVVLKYSPSADIETEMEKLDPDLPWAEHHFLERVSGKPLNPAPSYVDWPWHGAAKDKHIDQGVFDHTYPERYWPKHAVMKSMPLTGIRFEYGDLADVVTQLIKSPFTRQAYLPMWFPEDTGATQGQRVPCTLGYHFIRNGPRLDCNYFIRACDLTRHFKNDVYMTVRLMQWVTQQVKTWEEYPLVGNLTMFISNLHILQGDAWRYQS